MNQENGKGIHIYKLYKYQQAANLKLYRFFFALTLCGAIKLTSI